MDSKRVNIPNEGEITVYEQRIQNLRRIATLFRVFGLVGGFLVLVYTSNISIPAFDQSIRGITTSFVAGIVVGMILYSFGSLFEFLADTGLIVLSMKKETRYISEVVQEVRRGR